MTDSNLAGDIDDSTSTSGYVFPLDGASISWASKKQQSVALSTCEVEYITQTSAITEAIWLQGLLIQLGLLLNGANKSYTDNQGAIRLANNPEFHRRSKHIAIKYHYAGEK